MELAGRCDYANRNVVFCVERTFCMNLTPGLETLQSPVTKAAYSQAKIHGVLSSNVQFVHTFRKVEVRNLHNLFRYTQTNLRWLSAEL